MDWYQDILSEVWREEGLRQLDKGSQILSFFDDLYGRPVYFSRSRTNRFESFMWEVRNRVVDAVYVLRYGNKSEPFYEV